MSLLDRMADGYEPRFDIDYEVGRQGELLVGDLVSVLNGLSGGRVEVKTDMRALDTGNLYIEYECRRSGKWLPSGIAITEADWWGIVVGTVVIAAPVAIVKVVARRHFLAGDTVLMDRGSHPTKGVLIPIGSYIKEIGLEHQQ